MLKTPTAILSLLLAACSYQAAPPPMAAPAAPIGAPLPGGNLTFTAAPLQASPGTTMTLTLGNESRQSMGLQQPIGYNLCTSALRTGSGGIVQTGRVCTMELRTLQPGQAASYNHQLPSNLPDGRYYFSTAVEQMQTGNRLLISSNAFEVR